MSRVTEKSEVSLFLMNKMLTSGISIDKDNDKKKMKMNVKDYFSVSFVI